MANPRVALPPVPQEGCPLAVGGLGRARQRGVAGVPAAAPQGGVPGEPLLHAHPQPHAVQAGGQRQLPGRPLPRLGLQDPLGAAPHHADHQHHHDESEGTARRSAARGLAAGSDPGFFFLSQKEPKTEEPLSADTSFCSVRSEQPQKAAPGKGRLRSATSARSLASFPSQESLAKPETSSPQETPGHSALLSLPGYRPATRSSLRRSQAGSSSSLGESGQGDAAGGGGWGLRLAAPPALTASVLGRSSIYLGTCQDEPEQLDDWNRIAELQQRNRACPPHLKTCYPLESRVRGQFLGLPLPRPRPRCARRPVLESGWPPGQPPQHRPLLSPPTRWAPSRTRR